MPRTNQLDTDYVLGDEVAATPRRRSTTALVAVRVPNELLGRIQRVAAQRDATVSDLVREGLEQVLTQQAQRGTSRNIPTIMQGTGSFTDTRHTDNTILARGEAVVGLKLVLQS
jgi:hypothetical protein